MFLLRSPARGQMALDLLLAMIVLLVALNAFTPILDRFEDSQTQVSLSQQLRANARLSALFISDAVNQFRVQSEYPGRPSLAENWNVYAHFSGSLPLSSVRGLHTPQGFDCTTQFDAAARMVTFRISNSDAGIDDGASGAGAFVFDSDYPSARIQLGGCFAPLIITGGP